VSGPEENQDSVIGLGNLQQVGADQQVSVIPGGHQVGAGLPGAGSPRQCYPRDRVHNPTYAGIRRQCLPTEVGSVLG
jgi:hypothetical protein